MAADPISPGTYLRRRREAAGLTLPQLAKLYAYNPLGADAAEALLAEAERDETHLGWGVLDRLRRHIAFLPGIYMCLAQGLNAPRLCRICACSWDDACYIGGGGCAWTDHDRELCTACISKALAA